MSQPPEVSLAGTTTLDARLLEQLAVLLLRHALATLFDHGSHGQPLSLKLKAWCTQVGAKFLAHLQRRTEGYSTLCRPWDPKSPHQLIRTGQRRGPDMPSSHRRKRSAHLRPPMRLRQPQWYHPGSSPWIAGPQGARLLPTTQPNRLTSLQ